MKAKIKVLPPVVDYCAFMVSIALIRLDIDEDNAGFQWCSEDLCRKVKSLSFASEPHLR